MLFGQRKKIWKLTFQAVALRQLARNVSFWIFLPTWNILLVKAGFL